MSRYVSQYVVVVLVKIYDGLICCVMLFLTCLIDVYIKNKCRRMFW